MPEIPFIISVALMVLVIIQNILLIFLCRKINYYKKQLIGYYQNNPLNSTINPTNSPIDNTIANNQSNGEGT